MSGDEAQAGDEAQWFPAAVEAGPHLADARADRDGDLPSSYGVRMLVGYEADDARFEVDDTFVRPVPAHRDGRPPALVSRGLAVSVWNCGDSYEARVVGEVKGAGTVRVAYDDEDDDEGEVREVVQEVPLAYLRVLKRGNGAAAAATTTTTTTTTTAAATGEGVAPKSFKEEAAEKKRAAAAAVAAREAAAAAKEAEKQAKREALKEAAKVAKEAKVEEVPATSKGQAAPPSPGASEAAPAGRGGCVVGDLVEVNVGCEEDEEDEDGNAVQGEDLWLAAVLESGLRAPSADDGTTGGGKDLLPVYAVRMLSGYEPEEASFEVRAPFLSNVPRVALQAVRNCNGCDCI